MTENQDRDDLTDLFTDERAVEWMEEHLPELKQSVSGPRILYQSLVVGFVVGLAAHIGGYLLLSSVPGEPLGLFADLLHALGLSLWTGVVVAVFVQVVPEAKRRQISRGSPPTRHCDVSGSSRLASEKQSKKNPMPGGQSASRGKSDSETALEKMGKSTWHEGAA